MKISDLNGVSIFVEAVEAGGFSAAAARLNLSRSAVGKTVARLEARLGARLFHRTTRTQTLSEDGQAFYERCVRALEEIRLGEAALESGRREVAGRLRVSLPALFGRRCVAPALIALTRTHPKLELELNFSDRLVDLLQEGFDLAIRNGSPGQGAGLTMRRIGSQRMTVCAAPGYLGARGAPLTLESLERHEALIYGGGGRQRDQWLFPQGSGAPVAVSPKGRLRFDDLDAIADAAVAGMGLAWLPCWLIRERVASGELVRVLEDQPGLVFDIYALWPSAPRPPLRTRLAIDTLAEALPRLTG
jgi:DNA-binding transcriptional LysR family regulator